MNKSVESLIKSLTQADFEGSEPSEQFCFAFNILLTFFKRADLSDLDEESKALLRDIVAVIESSLIPTPVLTLSSGENVNIQNISRRSDSCFISNEQVVEKIISLEQFNEFVKLLDIYQKQVGQVNKIENKEGVGQNIPILRLLVTIFLTSYMERELNEVEVQNARKIMIELSLWVGKMYKSKAESFSNLTSEEYHNVFLTVVLDYQELIINGEFFNEIKGLTIEMRRKMVKSIQLFATKSNV